jgi:flagellar assembly factor FliW
VEDELLESIDGDTDENLFLMVTLTVPEDLTKMTANYKAPLIVNTETLKGIQIVAENEDYLVKFPIYDILKNRKGGE